MTPGIVFSYSPLMRRKDGQLIRLKDRSQAFYNHHGQVTTAPPHRRTAAPPHHRTAAPPHHRTAAPPHMCTDVQALCRRSTV
jgi:hypothetical protein